MPSFPVLPRVTTTAAMLAGGDAAAGGGGHVVNLDGTEFVIVGDVVWDTTVDWSFQCLFHTASDGTLLAKGAGPLQNWKPMSMSLHVYHGVVLFSIEGVGEVHTTPTVTDELWHRVAVTYSRAEATVRVYVDGLMEGQQTFPAIALSALVGASGTATTAGSPPARLPVVISLGVGTKKAPPRTAVSTTPKPVATARAKGGSPAGLLAGAVAYPTLYQRVLTAPDLGRGALTILPASFPGDLAVFAPVPSTKTKREQAQAESEVRRDYVCSSVATNLATDFSLFCDLCTTSSGPLVSKCGGRGCWRPGMKSLFVAANEKARGAVSFCIGHVGLVHGTSDVADGQWHRVGVTYDAAHHMCRIYVDGILEAEKRLVSPPDDLWWKMKIGSCAENFPRPSGIFVGEIKAVRYWRRAVDVSETIGAALPSPLPFPAIARDQQFRRVSI